MRGDPQVESIPNLLTNNTTNTIKNIISKLLANCVVATGVYIQC